MRRTLHLFLTHANTHVPLVQSCSAGIYTSAFRTCTHKLYSCHTHRPQSTPAIIILSAQHRKLMIILLFLRARLSLSLFLLFAVQLACPAISKYSLYAPFVGIIYGGNSLIKLIQSVCIQHTHIRARRARACDRMCGPSPNELL